MMYGLYGCYDQFGERVYIGNTGVHTIQKLEYNHRNWRELYGPKGWSFFRENLVELGDEWTFKWIQEPRPVSKTQIEIEEGACIRLDKPRYNIDQYPYEHSVREGRLEQI